MAETYTPYQNQNTINQPARFLHEVAPSATEAIITAVDFRPNLTREQIMHRIGEVAAFLWQRGEDNSLLFCEPQSSHYNENRTEVTFRVFHRDYDHDTYSIPHLNGWSGEESTSLYTVNYDTNSGQFDSGFIHPRNHRYHISEIEAKKRSGVYDSEMQALRSELWGEPEA